MLDGYWSKKVHVYLFLLILLIWADVKAANASNVEIRSALKSQMIDIAIAKLEHTLTAKMQAAHQPRKERVIELINAEKEAAKLLELDLELNNLRPEGFQLLQRSEALYIIGGDERGLMYGVLDLREQLNIYQDLGKVEAKTQQPRFSFRAIKFNLPWSSYRLGESLQLHMETVKDTLFWESFLDMMAENRFNALTLWNLHPFTFMIQPKAYPEATQFTGKEFADWRKFWKTLFRMAKNRGIETYIINWNIVTSPQMTAVHDVANYKDDLEWHYGFTPADTSQIIVDYMRECITQVINEYPNLSGVGVSIGERMKMPIDAAMKWVKHTFVEGILNADRQVKFIHRAPFSIDPEVAREYIESYTDFETPIIMEFKFNWSHAHSSPNLSITHGGRIKDQYWNPKPTNYQMAWMMRNEDFLMLNWGNSDFIRAHIAVNGQDFVAGYFVGSETYIPAKEYRMKPGLAYSWKYAFEKQWEFYQMWGRLLYDPNLSDSFFTEQISSRYGEKVGPKMFEALQLGSRMPLALASFYQGTWDFTLYCEGFLNGKQLYRTYKEATKAFINVEEMLTHPTLDPRYLNIDQFTDRKLNKQPILEGEITPLELAEEMEANGKRILQLYGELEGQADKNVSHFQVEMNDIKIWAYLSRYFASKLKGGVYLDEAVKTSNPSLGELSVNHLQEAVGHWENIVAISSEQYHEVSLLHIKTTKFSWKMYLPQVRKDIEIAQAKFE